MSCTSIGLVPLLVLIICNFIFKQIMVHYFLSKFVTNLLIFNHIVSEFVNICSHELVNPFFQLFGRGSTFSHKDWEETRKLRGNKRGLRRHAQSRTAEKDQISQASKRKAQENDIQLATGLLPEGVPRRFSLESLQLSRGKIKTSNQG